MRFVSFVVNNILLVYLSAQGSDGMMIGKGPSDVVTTGCLEVCDHGHERHERHERPGVQAISFYAVITL